MEAYLAIVVVVLEQLVHLGVHLVLVDEDLVHTHGGDQLDPLGKSDREVVWDVEALHTDGELPLLLPLLQLVVGDLQQSCGCVTSFLHQGHRCWVSSGIVSRNQAG